MENHGKTGCGYTVGACLRETMEQLDVWRRAQKQQERALHGALAAAQALLLLWSRLDEQTRALLDADIQIREQVRAVIGYYGF